MPSVFLRHLLALEDMAQMAAAVFADDLRAAAIDIRHSLHGAGNLVVKTWPATVAVKFVFGLV